MCNKSSGNLEWEDKKAQRGYIMWRKPEEWGSLVYQWVGKFSNTLDVLFISLCHQKMCSQFTMLLAFSDK